MGVAGAGIFLFFLKNIFFLKKRNERERGGVWVWGGGRERALAPAREFEYEINWFVCVIHLYVYKE